MTTPRALVLFGCTLSVCISQAVRADDLPGALANAYAHNPAILGARASQRGVDETVTAVRAQQLPSLNAAAEYAETLQTSELSPIGPQRSAYAQVGVSVPIYQGGALKNGERSARQRVAAGQADLASVTSQVFAQTVGVFMDVLRDSAIVRLNRHNVQTLEVTLKATTARFQRGDLTRTDVAQARARLALASANLRDAEAKLVSSRERYVQVVGEAPVDLAAPQPLAGMPGSVQEAIDTALENNPDLVGAHQRSIGSGYDVKVAQAARLPKVSGYSSLAFTDYLSSYGGNGVPPSVFPQHGTVGQAGLRMSLPLYQGGLPGAQIRAAQAQQDATQEKELEIERAVIATVRSGFYSWRAALDVIAQNQTAVEATQLGLAGVRAENSVGNRTIIEILNAEQEVLNAQVQLVVAQRNVYVTAFNLLAAMGQATPEALGIPAGEIYDPAVNARRVRSKFWDWSADPAPSADLHGKESAALRNIPPQDATTD